MKTIIVDVPDEIKAKLDHMRTRGYTINGFVRVALADALAKPAARTGRVMVRYRKPGQPWRRRTVPARLLEATVLKLEDAGAEILISPNSTDPCKR